MQAADDVEFRGAFRHALRGARPDFLERESVRPGRIRRAAEGAQLAMGYADIGRIDVPVDVEIADFPVALLPDVVGKPAQGQQVVRLKERQAILSVRRSPASTFCAIGSSRAIGNLESGHVDSIPTGKMTVK